MDECLNSSINPKKVSPMAPDAKKSYSRFPFNGKLIKSKKNIGSNFLFLQTFYKSDVSEFGMNGNGTGGIVSG